MTREEQFIYAQIIEANKKFKWERLARVLTSIISETIDLKFKETTNE